jgi:hypothetical protein
MKTSAILLSLALSAAAFSPAVAASNAKPAKPAPAEATLVENGETGSLQPAQPRTCRKEARPATNIPGRTICMTQKEWSQMKLEQSARGYPDTTTSRR